MEDLNAYLKGKPVPPRPKRRKRPQTNAEVAGQQQDDDAWEGEGFEDMDCYLEEGEEPLVYPRPKGFLERTRGIRKTPPADEADEKDETRDP
jgi:hypothetical protein